MKLIKQVITHLGYFLFFIMGYIRGYYKDDLTSLIIFWLAIIIIFGLLN